MLAKEQYCLYYKGGIECQALKGDEAKHLPTLPPFHVGTPGVSLQAR